MVNGQLAEIIFLTNCRWPLDPLPQLNTDWLDHVSVFMEVDDMFFYSCLMVTVKCSKFFSI